MKKEEQYLRGIGYIKYEMLWHGAYSEILYIHHTWAAKKRCPHSLGFSYSAFASSVLLPCFTRALPALLLQGAYGFAIRLQRVQRCREYSSMYKEDFGMMPNYI